MCARVFFSGLRAWPGRSQGCGVERALSLSPPLRATRGRLWTGHIRGQEGRCVFRKVWQDCVKDTHPSDSLLPSNVKMKESLNKNVCDDDTFFEYTYIHICMYISIYKHIFSLKLLYIAFSFHVRPDVSDWRHCSYQKLPSITTHFRVMFYFDL